MSEPRPLGGIIHTYQKYDPQQFPSPTEPPPDLVTPAFEHMLAYGDLSELTDEELARAIRIDPSQIAGLGPSLNMLLEMLRERKRKILAKYETESVQKKVKQEYLDVAGRMKPPGKLAKLFQQAVREEQIRDLEMLWYASGDDSSKFAREMVQLIDRLGNKYGVDELAGKYAFTGRQGMSVEQAIAIREELETIDRLIKQLEEAKRTAQIAVIDFQDLSEYADPEQMRELNEMQQRVEAMMRELAEQQGLERTKEGYRLTPKATRIFQGKLLDQIFSQLQAARSGRHQGPIIGEGAVELPSVKEYEFGDSIANIDLPQTLVNAMVRGGAQLPIRLKTEDIVVHRTRNSPKCATVVLMDMSGSMRYGGQYVNVKRMALALDGLIRSEYPGDFLQFVEIYSFAKPRHSSEIATLLPKIPTLSHPRIALRFDMSREEASEFDVPPHFTNLQHGLQLARRFLAAQDTPNRQVILITDGLPTAHFEGSLLHLLYPPHRMTEEATMREGQACRREGITINLFLLSNWSQSREDIQFAYRLAESTRGRVFFSAGKDLDRYVVWDYLNHRRSVVG
ncbi:MAG: VWA domain-containing protein [Planctomycetia bacterium]|nr:VWA domain-containing protein [Planctomycetia bacterium]